MYASQLWCNFRKSCMQRLRVAYNFGCRALYNLLWRASVSSHQVQCNIPTFEAVLRKNMYLFLERCRKSNNQWRIYAKWRPWQNLNVRPFSDLNINYRHNFHERKTKENKFFKTDNNVFIFALNFSGNNIQIIHKTYFYTHFFTHFFFIMMNVKTFK